MASPMLSLYLNFFTNTLPCNCRSKRMYDWQHRCHRVLLLSPGAELCGSSVFWWCRAGRPIWQHKHGRQQPRTSQHNQPRRPRWPRAAPGGCRCASWRALTSPTTSPPGRSSRWGARMTTLQPTFCVRFMCLHMYISLWRRCEYCCLAAPSGSLDFGVSRMEGRAIMPSCL